MAYEADISRANPACFLFLVDQSGSMHEPMSGAAGEQKAEFAASALNRIVSELIIRCSQGETIREYFYIGIITYATDGAGRPELRPVFSGTSLEAPFLLINEVDEQAQVEDRQRKISDGAGSFIEVTEKFRVWLQPQIGGGTPMCSALDAARQAVDGWIMDHPDAYPPTVINITDGMATDGDPESWAQEVTDLETSDGKALLFNAHISAVEGGRLQFPSSPAEIPVNDHAQMLYRMSSELPEPTFARAVSMDLPVSPGARGYVFNADAEALVRFLDIGTRPGSLH